MTVVLSQSALLAEASAVTLARYAQIVGYSECQLFGVANDEDTRYACRDIWTKSQRDIVAKYLAEAQEELEQVVGFPLSPLWLTDEQAIYHAKMLTKWGYVLAAGVRAETTVQAGAAVDHTADPAVIGPLATTVTDEDEIIVYHPGTDIEIYPSSVTISGGNVTIGIPRCRMVKEALANNPATGLSYDDTTNFESAVDVKRVYNDPSTNATLVWPHRCSEGCAACGCAEYTRTGCIYIRNAVVGIVDVRPATYAGGAWSGTASCYSGTPELARLNYRAGLTPLTRQAEDAIVRLAHAKMPEGPCGCADVERLWAADRNVPQVLTRERINCPFGLSDGAWIAYRFAQAMRIQRGRGV